MGCAGQSDDLGLVGLESPEAYTIVAGQPICDTTCTHAPARRLNRGVHMTNQPRRPRTSSPPGWLAPPVGLSGPDGKGPA